MAVMHVTQVGRQTLIVCSHNIVSRINVMVVLFMSVVFLHWRPARFCLTPRAKLLSVCHLQCFHL